MSRLFALLGVGAVCIFCGCARLSVNQVALAYYVAPEGDDANPGARGAPFASLERARDAVRRLILSGTLPEGGMTVYVRGGRYYRTAGFVLSARDSGVKGSPVSYRAFPGETVRLVGGRVIPVAAFRPPRQDEVARLPAESAGKVQCVDLGPLGLTAEAGLAAERRDGPPDTAELFFGKQLLQRVRSPGEWPVAPGEWCVDRQTGILYVWPPAPLAAAPLVLPTLREPIVTLDQTAFVTWRGITMENTRGAGVTVNGGHDNRIVACTVRNTGATGIIVSGARNGIIGCDVEHTGSDGITVEGGDRPTLQAAGNYADNNTIHDVARRQLPGAAALELGGVGNRATHNLIYNIPQTAILYGGNDQLVEANEIMLACLAATAGGAVHTGRDWGAQGNVIRGNFIHHLGGASGMAVAVYLEDCASGAMIEKNLFYRVGNAVLIGGGRDNQVINNVFVESAPAVRLDGRGRERIRWRAGPQESWDLQAKLEAMNYRQPPWSEHYPQLLTLLEDQPAMPLHNTVARNVCIGGAWLDAAEDLTGLIDVHDNFVTRVDPGFVNARRMDLRFRAGAAVWGAVPGFEAVPLREAGVYRSALRASWPVARPRIDSYQGTPPVPACPEP